MPGPEAELSVVLERLASGKAREGDLAVVASANKTGLLTLATGERAVAITGDATDAVIITGDRNIVLQGATAMAVCQALAALAPQRLHQLPADLDDFTGRETEIEKLLQIMQGCGGRAAVSALGGMGGIGKTALAVHVAHRLQKVYPDAQLVVELGGTSAAPLSPAAAQGQIIAAFRPEALLPESEAELTQLYRSILHSCRGLLLLDNVRDEAQVRPLLPPAPWGVIITSRPALALPGVTPLGLDTLPPYHARAFLVSLVGQDRFTATELDRLVHLCGCLPLALRASGTFLLKHQTWTASEYLQELTEEKARLTRLQVADLDVAATLGLSAAQLMCENPELVGRWQALTVFPASWDRDAAAAVWDCPPPVARDSLDELLGRTLLLFDAEKRRYRLHDLMRLVAQDPRYYSQGEAAVREADARWATAAARHAEYYCALLGSAHDLYLQGGDSILPGLELNDREAANIHTGQAWAAARLATRYPDAGAYVLNLRLYPGVLIAWLEAGISAARRLGDRNAEVRHLGNLGIAYDTIGEYRRAIGYHEQALAFSGEISDPWGKGYALGNLGIAYAALGETRRAIGFFEQALELFRKLGDPRGEGNALGNLGNAYAALGETRRAIGFYGQQLDITMEIGDQLGEGNALGGLGNAYAALGDARRAIHFQKQRLEIARKIGDLRGEGSSLGTLGNAYAALGETRQAIFYHEQALEITREIGNRRGEGIVLGNLGNAYDSLGEHRRAIRFYEQQLEIAREIGNRRGEGQALGNIANAYAALGEPLRAISLFEQRLKIAREIGDRRGESNVLGNLGNAYATLGDNRQAVNYHKQALGVSREIGDKRAEGQDLANLGNAYAALGETRRAIDFYEQALEIDREIGDRRGEGISSWNLALAKKESGEWAAAVELATAALQIFTQIEDPRAEIIRKTLTDWQAEGAKQP